MAMTFRRRAALSSNFAELVYRSLDAPFSRAIIQRLLTRPTSDTQDIGVTRLNALPKSRKRPKR